MRHAPFSLADEPSSCLGHAPVHFAFPVPLYSVGLLHPLTLLGSLMNHVFLRVLGGDREMEMYKAGPITDGKENVQVRGQARDRRCDKDKRKEDVDGEPRSPPTNNVLQGWEEIPGATGTLRVACRTYRALVDPSFLGGCT